MIQINVIFSKMDLSHGCVRVQEWQKLADYIIRNDSLNLKKGDTLECNTDSLRNWLSEKINRRIVVKNKFPLYIKYFGCELINGKIKFYDDIYADDRDMKQKYFAGK
jgi:L,D-transpeptidase YcbB